MVVQLSFWLWQWAEVERGCISEVLTNILNIDYGLDVGIAKKERRVNNDIWVSNLCYRKRVMPFICEDW